MTLHELEKANRYLYTAFARLAPKKLKSGHILSWCGSCICKREADSREHFRAVQDQEFSLMAYHAGPVGTAEILF